MELKVWIDGKLVNKGDAKVSVYDHGLLYGDGVFEGIRVYHGKVFESEAHLRRLYESAKSIRLTIPISPQEIQAAMEETVRANNFRDCYIRLIVTRGVGNLGLNPRGCERPSSQAVCRLWRSCRCPVARCPRVPVCASSNR